MLKSNNEYWVSAVLWLGLVLPNQNLFLEVKINFTWGVDYFLDWCVNQYSYWVQDCSVDGSKLQPPCSWFGLWSHHDQRRVGTSRGTRDTESKFEGQGGREVARTWISELESSDVVNKDFSLWDPRVDLGRSVVVMCVMWHAGCLDMDLLRRKAHSISLFVRGHCDILPPAHFM